ncbi:Ger(x)C family spore germination protein [Alkaliphilus transvaalensis]|uniref:Ger(x)C family spore germination protein n=1 Tax=Alkaliphilus transvaalensis TaxID=114628 RepID=UPI00047DE15F|nr:Ger(x)C family spore germination protein [Alkaliphilus transvaalensis]
MNKKFKLIVTVILLITLTGCWDSQSLEDLLTVYGIGIDLAPEDPNNYQFSIVFPTVIEEAPKAKFELSVKTHSLTAAKQQLQYKVYRQISYGNTRVVVFAHDAAEHGIIKHVDAMLREPVFPRTTRLVVVDTKAHELLEMTPPVSLFVTTFLFQAINQSNEATRVPFTTLRNFNYQYYTTGIEPVFPYINFNQSANTISIDSTALFKGDRLIHVLEGNESTYLMLLKGEINDGFYSTPYTDTDENLHHISLRIKTGKMKIRSELIDSQLYINQEITLSVNLAEYTGEASVFDHETIKEFEAYLAQHLEVNLSNTVKILQDLNSDNAGYGLYIRANHPEYFNPEEWGDQFSNALINIKVNINMHTVGITK